MDAPFVTSAGSTEDKAMEMIWKLYQIMTRLEVRQRRLAVPALTPEAVAAIQSEVDTLLIEAEQVATVHGMPYYLETACALAGQGKVDAALLDRLKSEADAALKVLAEKLEDAAKNSGEIEQLDALLSKGKYYFRIGSSASCDNNSLAISLFDEIVAKPKVTANRKIDALLEKAKVTLFTKDMPRLAATLETLSGIIDKSGDWDRKNKYKVLKGFQSIVLRDMPEAASLFFDGVATFASSEMCSYFEFMRYACITNLLSCKRKDIKKKLLDNAHVIGYFVEDPFMEKLISSLYNCNYLEFMSCLVTLEDILVNDLFFGPHASHILRELRIIAFVQYLTAYKSVSLSSMSTVFGVSADVLDRDLSNFISLSKISAKIDFEGDYIETIQNENRTVSFQEVIAKGDALLTHIQKLVRLLD